MELKKLIYTVEDGIAVITMDYMKNLNAIDEQMADELQYFPRSVHRQIDKQNGAPKGAPFCLSKTLRETASVPRWRGGARGDGSPP